MTETETGMKFGKLFEEKVWPELPERIGVMSVDALDRLWIPVAEEDGYLIARSKDGQAALLGRMGMRDDGKCCIEVMVRATIENSRLSVPEFWYVDPDRAQQFYDVMRNHINKIDADGDQ
ncbi:hypothetical protein NX871_31345 [Burkholderia thailandensis]|uniref:hypothetical protein n=1 Tax=Burkholderia thailandensis TaxID=57975 RepID=UPI00217D7AF7|nr:hypothetical protein [Burkholderia thailandensis]MCS6474353.1 hypothetical protein [Burkholderia thailandensis]